MLEALVRVLAGKPERAQVDEREVSVGSSRDEVKAAEIGEAVMDGLKALDHVAYIRFASVYKDFSEPGHFTEIAGSVGEEPAPADKPEGEPSDRLL